MTRMGMGRVALLAALILSSSKGIMGFDGPEYSPGNRGPWKRKKWQKGPSAGPGGPAVKLRIPKGKKP